MRRFLSVLLILATLLAICACGGETKDPQKQEEAPKPVDPLSKIEFVIDDEKSVPKNENELDEMLAELIAYCDNGRNVNVVLYGSDPDLGKLVEEKGFDFRSGSDIDVTDVNYDWGIVTFNLLDLLDSDFLISLVNEDIEKVVVTPGEMYKDPEFPQFDVTMYLDDEEVKVTNNRQLQVLLNELADACKGGQAYEGMGAYLHGFEVQSTDLTGIPYCHISHGSKNEPMTVLGFRYDVIGQLDAELVVDMLSICPYFTSVEFFAADDADKPALNK